MPRLGLRLYYARLDDLRLLKPTRVRVNGTMRYQPVGIRIAQLADDPALPPLLKVRRVVELAIDRLCIVSKQPEPAMYYWIMIAVL